MINFLLKVVLCAVDLSVPVMETSHHTSAVMANLYMEVFEELALETAPTRPRLWKRYVDDTFSILRKGSTKALLHHLNRVRPTIKFTVEQEEDGSLPLLDTLLKRREDGILDVSVYRKSTHTDRYLHFESYHPTHVKRGVVRCLRDRAREINSMHAGQPSEGS